jgi:hypothetical protein
MLRFSGVISTYIITFIIITYLSLSRYSRCQHCGVILCDLFMLCVSDTVVKSEGLIVTVQDIPPENYIMNTRCIGVRVA